MPNILKDEYMRRALTAGRDLRELHELFERLSEASNEVVKVCETMRRLALKIKAVPK
jgi:hypothetical protein